MEQEFSGFTKRFTFVLVDWLSGILTLGKAAKLIDVIFDSQFQHLFDYESKERWIWLSQAHCSIAAKNRISTNQLV